MRSTFKLSLSVANLVIMCFKIVINSNFKTRIYQISICLFNRLQKADWNSLHHFSHTGINRQFFMTMSDFVCHCFLWFILKFKSARVNWSSFLLFNYLTIVCTAANQLALREKSNLFAFDSYFIFNFIRFILIVV